MGVSDTSMCVLRGKVLYAFYHLYGFLFRAEERAFATVIFFLFKVLQDDI